MHGPNDTEPRPRDGGRKPTFGNTQGVSERLPPLHHVMLINRVPRPTENKLPFTMQRFLDDRQDEHLLHEQSTSQERSRKDGIQAAMDKIDQLELAGRHSKG
jgi:hypothetical protein